VDIARTRTVPKTLNPLWNQDFIFRVDPSKHRLAFEIYDQNKVTKDEFLGMFFVELNLNIPTESPEQPILTKDYPLLKRSVLQRVRGHATIGLCYINPPTIETRTSSSESENTVQNEPGFEVINHRDVAESIPTGPEPPLPPGWEERKDGSGRTYYVDHNSRTTTWGRPNGRAPAVPSRPQQQVADRHQIDDMDSNNARSNATTNSMTVARGTTTGGSTDDLGPLPPGWQMSKADNERPFFIDHINKRTTWIDPRTGKPSPQPAAQRELNQSGALPEHWEVRTLPDGRMYYIDHLNKTTTWTDPRVAGPTVPYSRDYQAKYHCFRRSLPRAKPHVAPQIELHINRKDVMETSFRAVMSVKDVETFKARLWIVFDGERGLDYGGLSREWFLILSREMFNPYYGLFEYSAIDNYTLQINPLSGLFNEEHIKYFRFIGRIIAMAIYHGKLLEAFFIRPFYKMLLSKPITLADMESVDREYYQSLKYIVDNDPTDLDLYFVVSEEVLGDLREHELKPGGQHIQVTEENKQEYIELVINYRFVQRIALQMNALRQGFQEILPLESLKVFDEKEVELLISGLGEINVNDWRTHTVYKGGYTPDNPVIQNFWKAIGSFNTEERTRLLQFITGTSRLPMNGFRELWGSSGPQSFTIEKWGDRTKLPRAHTCFNRIDLPPYESYQDLRQKLIQAMEMSEAFEGVD
jgi:E3 ubiquitin-protein ligase NEDD4